jgi:hypothetical protein
VARLAEVVNKPHLLPFLQRKSQTTTPMAKHRMPKAGGKPQQLNGLRQQPRKWRICRNRQHGRRKHHSHAHTCNDISKCLTFPEKLNRHKGKPQPQRETTAAQGRQTTKKMAENTQNIYKKIGMK